MFESKYYDYLKNIGYDDYIHSANANNRNFELDFKDNVCQRNISRIENENFDEVIMVIKNSINDEKEDDSFYTMLLSQAMYEEDREIINSVVDDEKKHNRILKEVYKDLTGNMFNENRSSIDEENINKYYMNLKKAMFGELDAIKKYRNIMSKMPDMKNYSRIMEIMTDEIRHAIKYNYLISKNRI